MKFVKRSMKFSSILPIVFMGLFLTHCGYFIRPYQPTLKQGNINLRFLQQQLHKGMSRTEVTGLLGTSLLQLPTQTKQSIYVQQFLHAQSMYLAKLIIQYKNNTVSDFQFSEVTRSIQR